MFGTFDGEISVPTELREATQELDALKALLQSFAMDLEEPEGDQRPPKWPKPGPKGAPGGGKGKRQPQPRGARFGSSWKDNDWRNQGQQGQWEWEPRQPQWTSQQEETQAQQLSKLQAIISMLTTLVLRQEVQLSVRRQDTAYVVFIKTHGQDNLAQSLYAIGQKWHQLKQSSPEKLTAPMRSVLFQHFVETIKQKFQQMLATPSSRSHAQELGLISDNGNAIPALRWDTTSKTHVPDTRIEALQPVEIKALLDQLLILGSKEFVVTRFHGMRKLSEEYSSPTLGMFLEIGNRTSEAKEAWEILHKLNQSAAWMAGGCYLRHERMQLSALAKRLAADGPDHTSNMMLRRNVSDDFNCVVTAQSLLHKWQQQADNQFPHSGAIGQQPIEPPQLCIESPLSGELIHEVLHAIVPHSFPCCIGIVHSATMSELRAMGSCGPFSPRVGPASSGPSDTEPIVTSAHFRRMRSCPVLLAFLQVELAIGQVREEIQETCLLQVGLELPQAFKQRFAVSAMAAVPVETSNDVKAAYKKGLTEDVSGNHQTALANFGKAKCLSGQKSFW
ncbi:hypothetical protein AK812_SmicGene17421 [Symbiodinium microadriaticum]|uniref:Uncharacterized protein n=1 Tax=Symbiodinium microadriaticum TaxID=2951 RepID=A0A1Q9DXP8_SYMMI|nr:hypothetical protein AK812_SmicGene17421 [Symbiodinium microadriaticum]